MIPGAAISTPEAVIRQNAFPMHLSYSIKYPIGLRRGGNCHVRRSAHCQTAFVTIGRLCSYLLKSGLAGAQRITQDALALVLPQLLFTGVTGEDHRSLPRVSGEELHAYDNSRQG
jgi:hypothetical protein